MQNMWPMLVELRERIAVAFPPPQIDRIYIGIDNMPRQTLRMDTPLLILDDAGEVPIADRIMHHVQGYNISFQMIVSHVSTEQAVELLLTRWAELATFLFQPENRWLERTGIRIIDEMEDFPNVEPGLVEADDELAPTWRWRRSVITYRKADCSGGYHTP